jgi:RND family efflux transporter MFP subunit
MKTSTLVFICALLLAACGAPDKKAQLESLKKQRADLETKITALEEELSKTDSTSKEKVMEVVAKPATEQIFKTYIEVQGRVDADENVSLSSEIPGTITKINVKVGDEVTKGQVLAETDSRPMQQQLSDLQTSYDLAKQMFEKQENLWNQKIGTEIQYLQAKSGKESLEKKIAAVQEQIRMSKIISPIDGTVDNVNIKIGQMVAPGLNAISVINFSNLKVKADVAETYASRVKIGNEVQVLFPDIKDSVVSKVRYASRAINPMSRTFNVEVGLDNKKEYHPNMVAKIRINDFQSEKPEVVLPEKYIQKGSNELYVMVAENGKAVRKVVQVGKEYRGNAEILSGLKAGDVIITEGYDLVNEGDKVAVKK